MHQSQKVIPMPEKVPPPSHSREQLREFTTQHSPMKIYTYCGKQKCTFNTDKNGSKKLYVGKT